tara:strand:+ start:235 stop:747 length:513 start_codon:yes stop_codon:yes gene_type:complete
MDQSIENKKEIKDRAINFFNNNKTKIYVFIFIFFIALASFFFLKINNEKKNILAAEKYVEAGLYLASNKKDSAIKIYEEIILSDNNFYSILSLNSIIEKDLILDKNKILKYFDILDKTISKNDQRDLLTLKKALYLIKILDIDNGKKLLKKLLNDDTILKPIAEELLKLN